MSAAITGDGVKPKSRALRSATAAVANDCRNLISIPRAPTSFEVVVPLLNSMRQLGTHPSG
jgi:hypothetical protein